MSFQNRRYLPDEHCLGRWLYDHPEREPCGASRRDLKALRLRKAGVIYRDIGARLGVKTSRAREIVMRAERRQKNWPSYRMQELSLLDGIKAMASIERLIALLEQRKPPVNDRF